MDSPGREASPDDDIDEAPRSDASPGRRDRDAYGSSPETNRRDDAGEAAPRRPWLRPLAFIGGGIVAVVLVIGGVLYWLHARHFETTDDAFIDGYMTQMSPRVSGQVTHLLFRDNEHVNAGQTLLTIDPRDYEAKLQQANAQRASARAQLQQAEANLAVRRADLDQARANAQASQASLVQKQQDSHRYNALGPHAVTRQQIDDADAALRSARANLDAAQQAVNGGSAQVQAAQAAVVAAQATVQQADASVSAATLQLSYCTIAAPVSGIIGHRTVAVGNYVNPGQPLFAIVQDNPWVTANFKETALAAMHPGQPVQISVDAIPSVTFHGVVQSMQPGTGSAFSVLPAENATGNYVKIVQRVPVKIVFDDSRIRNYQLSPGMSVEPVVRVR